MARRLTGNVQVGGEWFGPDYGNADQVPSEVAEKIGDHLWEGDVDEATQAAGDGAGSAPDPQPKSSPAKSTAARGSSKAGPKP